MNEFESAVREVFTFLRRRLGFDLWMVTRKEKDDWIVLHCDDHNYEIRAGQVFRWGDSFCSEMVKGSGPRIAPDSSVVNSYSAAAIGKQFKIGAYIGVPILLSDGSIFGTLCALHPDSRPASIQKDQELLDLIGLMLSKILQMELKADEESSRAERFEAQALSDALTGLYNRAGWEQLSSHQDSRNKRYGKYSAVLVVDLDDLKVVNDKYGHAAGDDLIRSAANALLHASRSEDIVARLGGDEFAIIGVNCDKSYGDVMRGRVKESLGCAGIRASIGLAMASAKCNISFALTIADQQMYEEKRLKKNSSSDKGFIVQA